MVGERGGSTAYAWQAHIGIRSRAEYEVEYENMKNQGYRLVDLNGYGVHGEDHYAAIWEKSPGPQWVGKHFLDQQQHQQQLEALRDQGFRPVCVSGYEVAGVARYASLWEQRSGPTFVAFHHITAEQMQANYEELKRQGFRPIDICGYVVGDQVLFTAIWEQSPIAQWDMLYNVTESKFLIRHARNASLGFMPKRISGYEIMGFPGQRFYAAIWEKIGQGAEPEITWAWEHNVRSAYYQSSSDMMVRRGFRPVKINGIPQITDEPLISAIWHKPYLSDNDEAFIDNWIRIFMVSHQVPGLSVALTYRGRLVFARGYGVANPITNELVAIDHLFRIASVSKSITAVAIFKLIEAGQLQLETPVFGDAGVLGTNYGTQHPYRDNIDKITVQHLLEHTSGWPENTDPMFGHLDRDQDGLINWMLDEVPLTTVPGDVHSYLNFGYCVLGRIIERVSGLSYADYVKQNVLAPCGISDMHIAGDTLADRRENEVVYVPQDGDNPYNFRISRMDAAGGWIASPTDLSRFLVHVDGFATKPNILTYGSIATMSTPTTAVMPPGKSPYAKGWGVNSIGNCWHLGDLPGTASFIVRTQDEYCWAVLVNSRHKAEAQIEPMRKDLDNLMWPIVRRITDWPAFDLF